ncbi:MAG TPA: FtsW/RodA/SpoVE family cell cycle protein [Acidimicrobiia bacterium]|nr:FtsW/RodA/SpoVE family cell cycle protein [Acidimicrobiia bacterium]
MTRTAETGLLVAAAVIAALGVTLVSLAAGGTIDARIALTFLVMMFAFGAVHLALRRWAPGASTALLAPAALLTAIGLAEIQRLNPTRAGLQQWWLVIAAALTVGLLRLLHRQGLATLRRYRYLFLAGSLLLLLLPMLPSNWALPIRGLEANGSRLWVLIDLGLTEIRFQPGEIAKLVVVLFLASYLAERQPALSEGRRLGPFRLPEPRLLFPVMAVWAGSLGVLIGQRDLGASVLLFGAFVGMLYAATGQPSYLVVGSLLTVGGGFAAYRLFDHVGRRVVAWLTPFADYEDAGYQIAQAWFGMGTGSLAGSGLGLGRPSLIPNAETDFIFAAVAEELGFAGSMAVLAMYAILVAVGFGIALRSRDRFRKLAAAGLTWVLGLQTFLIIGGVLRLVPLTGITLPFMSYGGSSLVGNFLLLGLLARISHEEEA